MRIHIDQKELLQALKTLAPTVGKDAINVTNGVLFSVSHTEVKLTSSNFETATIVKVEAKIDDIGEMVVNYKLLFDIVNRCTGQIIIEKIGDDLNLFNGEAQYKLSWIAADLFPEVVVDEDLDNKITIERADFEAGIKTSCEVSEPFKEKFEVAFNSHYLKEILNNCSDEVEIASNGPHSPFYITEGSKSFVIMPMRYRGVKG